MAKSKTSTRTPWSAPVLSEIHHAAATFAGAGNLQAKVMRNPRIVEDIGDIDVGQGNQARSAQKALERLRSRDGLVLKDYSRPELRRRIEKEVEAENKRTGAADTVPSRQVMDRVLLDLAIR
jgi:hypothetical protein